VSCFSFDLPVLSSTPPLRGLAGPPPPFPVFSFFLGFKSGASPTRMSRKALLGPSLSVLAHVVVSPTSLLSVREWDNLKRRTMSPIKQIFVGEPSLSIPYLRPCPLVLMLSGQQREQAVFLSSTRLGVPNALDRLPFWVPSFPFGVDW